MPFIYNGQYGPTAILDAAGQPVANQPVTVYVGTTTGSSGTLATLYQGYNSTTTVSNPVSTDSYGNLTFFAQPGQYTLYVNINGIVTTYTVTVHPWPAEYNPPTVGLAYFPAGAAQTQVLSNNTNTPITTWPNFTTYGNIGFTQSSGTFTVGVAGLYVVEAQLTFEYSGGASAAGGYSLTVLNNSAQVLQTAIYFGNPGDTFASPTLTGYVQCNAGDQLSLVAYVDLPSYAEGASSVAAIPFTNYGYSNFFAVRLVAPL
jgi:hypothetical protein